MKQIISLG